MTRRARFFQATLAVVIGTVVTLMSICALAMLNRSEVAQAEVESSVRTVSLDGGGGSPSQGSPGGPSGNEATTTAPEEVMSVNLDAPAIDAPAIAALDISPSLPAPNVAAIPVFVGPSGNIATPGASIASASLSRGVPGGTGQGTGTGGTGTGTGNGSGGTGNGTGGGNGNGNGIGDADHVDQPPREPSGNAKPSYPERERQLGIEGTVMVKLLINERGLVEDAKILSGPEAFRKSVLQVVHTWRFEPARDKGRVIKVWGTKEVKFTHPRNRT